jgi:hypothetical protein
MFLFDIVALCCHYKERVLIDFIKKGGGRGMLRCSQHDNALLGKGCFAALSMTMLCWLPSEAVANAADCLDEAGVGGVFF